MNINIMIFHIPHTVWPREIELAELDCITDCLSDNSSKFSYFSNSISAWLQENKYEFIKLV